MSDLSGWFYKTFIDPLLAGGRKTIAEKIPENQSILDVACGTGAQVFELAKKAKKVVGVDLSEKMIQTAQKEKAKLQLTNVDFKVTDATNLNDFKNKEFDVVTLSMALHQFSPELHSPILNEIKRVGKTILLVDYSIPLPKNHQGFAAKIIEFMAGKEHNKNFIKYSKLGGLNKILSQNQLKIEHSETFAAGIFQFVKCISD